MFDLRVLSKEDTEKLLKIGDVIQGVEAVYKQKAEENAVVFPLVFHEFEPGNGDMDIKSGWLKESGIFGLKQVSWFGENPSRGLPALIGMIMVFNDQTGKPIGITDGSYITGIRTGAAGALGAKYLARPDAKTLLVVGAGHVATFQVAATLSLMKDIEQVLVYDAMDFNGAKAFAASIGKQVSDKFGVHCQNPVQYTAVKDIAKATGESDIIITVTPSKEPIIKRDWVKAGTHFSCIGADMSGKQEIAPEIIRDARVFADDLHQCIQVGEIERPIKEGFLQKEALAGEIGDIIIGRTQGRKDADQITVFDATGTALLDLITAQMAFDAAEQYDMGTTITI